jgi:hypothetical protein
VAIRESVLDVKFAPTSFRVTASPKAIPFSVPDSPGLLHWQTGQLWRIGKRCKITSKIAVLLTHRRIASFFRKSKNIVMANPRARAGLYSLRSPSL